MSLHSGAVRPRPPRGRSQAHPGIHPVSPLTHQTQRFLQLPAPLGLPPYHYDLAHEFPELTKLADKNGKVIFHTCGDTGGIKNPDKQRDVAAAMKTDLNQDEASRPQFFYHLGEVVYYNGLIGQYYDQFYEPYDHYDAPIIAIPGNHDGDAIDESDFSLDGWVRYFMSDHPQVRSESADAPRVTMSLPNCYFTVNCPFVTIVGMYTNVPEHGSIDSVQQQWLTHELATAPEDKALIVALHHPVYSFDDHHSGSPRMADALQHAINDSRRVPNLVLTAHVHNYQRIERQRGNEPLIPFLVAGHGGYYHLHGMNAVAGETDSQTDATLVFEQHKKHGYVTLTVDANTISGTMTTAVSNGGDLVTTVEDNFAYRAGVQKLPNGIVISL